MTDYVMSLTPNAKQQFFDNNGAELSGGKVFVYSAGTTTKINSYTDDTGNTANTNPIILNTRGECNIWMPSGVGYKLVLSPSTDTDPPTNPFWTVDHILIPAQPSSSSNGTSPAISQTTINSSTSLTNASSGDFFVASTALTLSIAQSTTLTGKWWVQVYALGGAVTMAPFSSDAINGGSAGNSLVIPQGYAGTVITDAAGNIFIETFPASLGTGSIAASSSINLGGISAPFITVTGAATITSLGNSPAGVQKVVTFTNSGAILTYSPSLLLPGGLNYITQAGDVFVFGSSGNGNWFTIAASNTGNPVLGSISGLVITADSSSPTSVADITAAGAILVNANGNGNLYTNISQTVNITLGNSVAITGGMDGSPPPATGKVYLYLIGNGSTLGAVGSNNVPSTGPNLPSGYTTFLYVGARFVKSNALLNIIQRGDEAQYINSNTGVPVATSGTAGTLTSTSITALASVDVSSFIPATASRIRGILKGTAQAGLSAWVSPNINYTGDFNGATFGNTCVGLGGADPEVVDFGLEFDFLIETNQTIGYAANSSVAGVTVTGWVDGAVGANTGSSTQTVTPTGFNNPYLTIPTHPGFDATAGAANYPSGGVISNNNKTFTTGSGANYAPVWGLPARAMGTGKFYFEVVFVSGAIGLQEIGVTSPYGRLAYTLGSTFLGLESAGQIGFYSNGVSLANSGYKWTGDDGGGLGATGAGNGIVYAVGDVIGVVIDTNAQEYYMKDVTTAGYWNGIITADPVAGVGGIDISRMTTRTAIPMWFPAVANGTNGGVTNLHLLSADFVGAIPAGCLPWGGS